MYFKTLAINIEIQMSLVDPKTKRRHNKKKATLKKKEDKLNT